MRKYINMNFKIKKMFVNGELDRDKAEGSNLRLALVRNGTLNYEKWVTSNPVKLSYGLI
jgi:hypothetical protein